MHFIKSLLALAPFFVLAYAQSQIVFTSSPVTIDAGNSFNITWVGGDSSSVTLTLRRGSISDLDLTTVSTIASAINGYWYFWDVPSNVADGDNYVLQITQGQSGINWTGLFSIRNAVISSSSSKTSTITSTIPISSITSAASVSAGTTIASSTDSARPLTSEATSSSIATQSSASNSESATPSNNTPVKAGIGAGVGVAVLIAIGFGIFFMRRRRQSKKPVPVPTGPIETDRSRINELDPTEKYQRKELETFERPHELMGHNITNVAELAGSDNWMHEMHGTNVGGAKSA